VLSRRLNEKIVIPSINTAVQVVSVKPGVVRLGIQAPPEVTVLREEIVPQAEPAPCPARFAETALAAQRLHTTLSRLAVLRRQIEANHPATRQTLDQIEEELRALQGEADDPAPTSRSRRPCVPVAAP